MLVGMRCVYMCVYACVRARVYVCVYVLYLCVRVSLCVRLCVKAKLNMYSSLPPNIYISAVYNLSAKRIALVVM